MRDGTKHWDGEDGGGCGRNIFCKMGRGKEEGGRDENLIILGGAAQNSNSGHSVNNACITQYFTRKCTKDRNTVRK